jgi:hypothetical protein
MGYVIAGIALAFGAMLVVGAISGRVKAKNCCSIADPMQDLRMQPYLLADEQEVLRASATPDSSQ